jgi:hypothetical protein
MPRQSGIEKRLIYRVFTVQSVPLLAVRAFLQYRHRSRNRKKVDLMLRTITGIASLATALLVLAGNGIAAAPSVPISASQPVVVYGSSVTLSGKIADHAAGQTVTVLDQPSGASTFTALGSVTTTAGGHWSDTVKPTIETAYEASWMNQTSSTVTVKVRPMITLTLVNLNSGTFSTKVTGARSFAGKFVLVQRLSSTGVATVKKVTLDANSSATFTVRLHHGSSRLRVVMPTSQTEPGYITGMSDVLTVTR